MKMDSAPRGVSPLNFPATPIVENNNIRTIYDVEKATVIGKGGFSQVVSVLHRPTNTMRALKVVKKEILKGKVAEMIVHEREILRHVSHPNIIKLHETIISAHHWYFALDLMAGDLFELILQNKTIPEPIARTIMHQVLCGIKYLHDQCIVHRDIKPENILLNITHKETGHGSELSKSMSSSTPSLDGLTALDIEVKIADFGLAKIVQNWDVQSTPCGTSFYIAPEVIRGIEAQGAKPLCTTQQLVKSVDVWSAGVVLFVMLGGRPPFHGQVKTSDERRQLLHRIDRGVLFNPNHGWGEVSEEAKDLILRMLNPDSGTRCTVLQALQHPFFTAHGMRPPAVGVTQRPTQPARSETAAQTQTREGNPTNNTSNNTHPSSPSRTQGHGHKSDETDEIPNPTVQKKKRNSIWNLFSSGKRHPGHRAKHGAEKPVKDVNDGPHGVELEGTVGGNGAHNASGHPHTHPNGSAEEEEQTSDVDEAQEEHMRSMQAEINAIQQVIIATGDKDGDKTSYKQSIPMYVGNASRTAAMNTRAKIGPAALKK